MFNFIKRFFAVWKRIPKHRVPRWVRGKLYKRKYVVDREREYKVVVKRKKLYTYRYALQQGHWEETHSEWDIPSGCSYFVKMKKWKEVKYYYRKI